MCKNDPSPLASNKYVFDKKSFEDASDKQVECSCRTGRDGIANYGQMYRCCVCFK